MSESVNIANEILEESITKGIEFLSEHQLPNGEYISYYSPDDKMEEWCVPDSIVFFTSVISNSLLKMRERPKVPGMLLLSKNFLRHQMMSGGVWNYFTKWNPLFKYSPADIDDTVFASLLLQNLDGDFADNKSLLLANTNEDGLFYTWFILRGRSILKGQNFKVMARELKRPLNSILFWKKHAGGRNDIDAAVNANVLHYLGPGEHTESIKAFLSNIIIENLEVNADKWYRNPIILYYLISRNHPIVNFAAEVVVRIVERIFKFYRRNGQFGNSALETAFAIMTLMNFNVSDDSMKQSVRHILENQQSSGYWSRHIFFYSGPDKAVGWGSEELSTAICIEALNQYKNLKGV